MQQDQGEFSYTSAPHAAPMKSKTKYRDENRDEGSALNLMSDPRVIRGSTYAAKVSNTETGPKATGKRGRRNRFGNTRRSSTPPPVHGRSHMDVQTDEVLEELTDKPIELDMETQTPAINDRPPSPLFVKAKIGVDMETQIAPGDLFNFDVEVAPILEVLVGKTLHVAMLEIMQEEELAAIASQQLEFETIRNIELAEVQRLEAELKRKAEEKQRRVEQEAKRKVAQRELEEKVGARSFSQQYLNNLHINVFDTLQSEGFFYDPVRKEVEDVFMVGVIDNLKKQVDAYDQAQQLGMMMIKSAISNSKTFSQEAVMLREEYKKDLARKKAEEEARIKAEAEEAARLAAEAEAGEGAEEE
jgi:radial spoke head protein 3